MKTKNAKETKEQKRRRKAFLAYERRWKLFELGLADLMAKHGVENYAVVAFLKRELSVALSEDESGWHEILKAKYGMRTPMSWMVMTAYKDIALTGAATDGEDLDRSI